MNESEFLRRQLATERAHLREILQAAREGSAEISTPQAVANFGDWAGRRLVTQLGIQCEALQAVVDSDAQIRAQLAIVFSARSAVIACGTMQPLSRVAEPLLALLDAWSDALDSLAGSALPTSHWRRAAHLSADTILEERQLYAAARRHGI
jgi:hypothetical protein